MKLFFVFCAFLLQTWSSTILLERKVNGVCLVSPSRKISSRSFDTLQKINAQWVAVIPYAFSKGNTPKVRFDDPHQWWGERTEGAMEMIKYSKMQGLKVMLKPHVWVMGQGWAGDYQLSNESDWKIWEGEYSKYILNYAKVADSLNVDILCIGTEYRIPAKERPLFWRELISKVKSVYSGSVTYASNWDNYDKITWWDAVDFVGVDAYFPLSDRQDSSIDDIIKGWEKWEQQLQKFSVRVDKKIMFTEYGFQSAHGAAGKHWKVVHKEENVNFENQVNAYEATFQKFWNQEWFMGGFLWKWHLQDETSNHETYHLTRFTPQNKPAEAVISKWYGKK